MSQRGVWQGQWDYPVILPVRLSDQGASGPGCPQEGPAQGWGSCSHSADPMVGCRGDFKPSSLQPEDTEGRAARPEAVSRRDCVSSLQCNSRAVPVISAAAAFGFTSCQPQLSAHL